VVDAKSRPSATLVDLLDRVLDRGVVINADIIISLAGVPLIGVNLRAALAGIETMVQYGVMRKEDLQVRAQEAEAGAHSMTPGGLSSEMPCAPAATPGGSWPQR